MLKRLLPLAASLATALPSPVAALPTVETKPQAEAAHPALWVIRDADTTIYLFGTFHALDGRTDWFAKSIRSAFDSADELVLETLIPSNPAELFRSLSRHSLMPTPVVGQPVTAGGFAGSARQAMSAGGSAGLTVDSGADAVLRRLADRDGKPVDGLESFDAQLSMFAALPTAALKAPAAPQPIVSASTPAVDTRQVLVDLRESWQRGDGSRFAAVLTGLQAQSPAAYQRLFIDRNDQWARWIAERMTRPGTVFVAVGTGHLIGRDCLQQQLASRGFTTLRVN